MSKNFSPVPHIHLPMWWAILAICYGPCCSQFSLSLWLERFPNILPTRETSLKQLLLPPQPSNLTFRMHLSRAQPWRTPTMKNTSEPKIQYHVVKITTALQQIIKTVCSLYCGMGKKAFYIMLFQIYVYMQGRHPKQYKYFKKQNVALTQHSKPRHILT